MNFWRVIRCWTAGFVFLASSSMAYATTTEDEVHRLALAEKYDSAMAIAQEALRKIPHNTPSWAQRRRNGIDLVLETAYPEQLARPEMLALIQEAQNIDSSLYPKDDRRRAKGIAWEFKYEAAQPTNAARQEKMKSLLLESKTLLEGKAGAIKGYDEAFIYRLLGDVAFQTQKFGEALEDYSHAERALRNAHGQWEEVVYARVLLLKAECQSIVGQSTQALENAASAVATVERLTSWTSFDHLSALTYQGQVQMYARDLMGAKKTFQTNIEIAHQRNDPYEFYAHEEIALAYILKETGDFDHARVLLEEIIRNNEIDKDGKFTEILPEAITNLAGIENRTDHLRARPLYERALELEQTLNGKSHPYMVEKPLINLGMNAFFLGDNQAAKSYFKKAEEIDSQNPNTYLKPHLLSAYAQLSIANGELEKAQSLLQNLSDDLTDRYSQVSQLGIQTSCNLALVQAREGNKEKAFAIAEAAENSRINLIDRVGPALPDSYTRNLKETLASCAGVLLELASELNTAEYALRAWRTMERSRGVATHLLAKRIQAAQAIANADGKQKWDAWQRAASSYAQAVLGNRSKTDVDKAQDALNQAEQTLGEKAADLVSAADELSLQDLLARHSDDAIVLAYEFTPHVDLGANARGILNLSPIGGETPCDLFAFVSDKYITRIVALGSAARLDAVVQQWVRLIRDPGSNVAEVAAAGLEVRASIWDPLKIAGGSKRVLVAPDGSLFRINFSALPSGDHFMVEDGWLFHELDHERDLGYTTSKKLPPHLLLVGAPDFGRPPAVKDDSQCAMGFADLPGADQEIKDIERVSRRNYDASPTILSGTGATKSSFMEAAKNSSIVHLATHAFGVETDCPQTYASRGISVSTRKSNTGSVTNISALALAGANQLLIDGSTQGIFTSEEAAGLRLDHTQWVVLAACDTGLGTVVGDEGVFGLRRGFRLAGAQTVVMSLWKVEDTSTAQLMHALYESRWQKHTDTPTAMADAELAVLSDRRARGESTHPFYWASFVASGDWH